MRFNSKTNTFLEVAKSNPKDRIEVIVGDDKEPDVILPQAKIQRWDNECNVSIRLKDFNNYSVIAEKDKVIFGDEKREVHLYNLPQSQELNEGGYELEVIFHEKPASNVIEFTLVDKDVEYFYQPPLNQEPLPPNGVSATETDVFDKDGKSITNRPENVVGSYAVYAKTPKHNYVGGKEYRCGKVGHIYRPKIIDSVGKEVWGELHIENGILSVTIPQEFLDKAIYPVKVDPTFGYTEIGESKEIASNYQIAKLYQGGIGYAESISYAVSTDAHPGNTYLLVGIYEKDASGEPGELLASSSDTEVSLDITGAFKTIPLTSSFPILGIDYFLCGFLKRLDEDYYHYDVGDSGVYYKGSREVRVLTNPFDPDGYWDDDGQGVIVSIYCTYFFELPPGTYYWRVRAKDPSGSNTWGEWSSTRSFTIVEKTDSTRNAKITGKADADSERSAKLRGTETVFSERKAKIPGIPPVEIPQIGLFGSHIFGAVPFGGMIVLAGEKFPANSERQAKIKGKDISESERLAKIVGKQTITSEKLAKVIGKSSFEDEKLAKITGYDTDEDERLAKVVGQETDSSERQAKLTGRETIQSEREAKLSGYQTASDGRLATLRGKDTSQDERRVKTIGKEISSSERQAKIEGVPAGVLVNSERFAKITGKSSETSERFAKVRGLETHFSERQAKVLGQGTEASERLAKIKGIETIFNEKEAKTKGKLTSEGERLAKLKGIATDRDERQAKIVGKDTASSERAAKIIGGLRETSERSAKIEGKGIRVGSERQAKIRGTDEAESERRAKVFGVEEVNSERQAKIVGIYRGISERQAKVKGYETLESERQAKIRGGEKEQDERQAKLLGKKTLANERAARLRGKETAESERFATLFGKLVSSRRASIRGAAKYEDKYQIQGTEWQDKYLEREKVKPVDKEPFYLPPVFGACLFGGILWVRNVVWEDIYSDKYQVQGTIYDDEYEEQGTEWQDKYEPQETIYQRKY